MMTTRRSVTSLAIPALVILSLLAVSGPPAAGQGLETVRIRAAHVAGTVHMLEGRGGNIGVSAGADGVLIVDDQFEELAPKIAAALGKLGSDTPKFVLNTHFHGDHTGGNAVFGKKGTILAHDNVRARLVSGTSVLGRDTPPALAPALPVITFGESLTVHFNGEVIRAVHLPSAHTDGDAIVFFDTSGVVHMGDTFFAGSFPFVDIGNGGSIPGLIDGLRKLLPEIPADAKIIPGHGPLSTKKDLQAYLGMLEQTAAIVRSRMTSGASLEECQEMGLPGEWESWGRGFINTESWVGTLYRGLAGGKSSALTGEAAPADHGHSGRR